MRTRATQRLTLLVAVAIVVALVAPGGASAATVGVSIVDFDFLPREITIRPGDTVVWRNNGVAPHTVMANNRSFESDILNSADTFSRTFSAPGRYAYHCHLHPQMAGVVIVAADGTTTSSTSTTIPTPSVPIAGAAFYIDGTSDQMAASGAPVSVFATGAEPGFSYKLVSGRGTGQRPCSTDVMAVNDTPRFANAQGVIARSGGTPNRPPGQWQICFLAEGQVVTGAVTYTVIG